MELREINTTTIDNRACADENHKMQLHMHGLLIELISLHFAYESFFFLFIFVIC